MRARFHGLTLTLLFAGLAAVTTVGCYHHHDYDSVSVHWTTGEEPYYESWEKETHRDHRDYSQRSADEQHSYWDWRHSHQS
jgi:hypothetical protein